MLRLSIVRCLFIAVVALSGAALGASEALTSRALPESCVRVELGEEGLTGIHSGIDFPQGSSDLLLIDSNHKQMLHLQPDGFVKDIFRGEPPAWAPETPSFARRGNNGNIYVEDERGEQILELTDTLQYVGARRIFGRTVGPVEADPLRIDAIYDWIPAKDGGFVALADLKQLSKDTGLTTWQTSLVSFGFNRTDNPDHIVLPLSSTAQSSDLSFISLDLQYLATLGDSVFFLWLKGQPELFRFTPAQPGPAIELIKFPTDIGGFPSPKTSSPEKDPLNAGSDLVQLFAEFEATTSPVGLFATETRLFVLAKTVDQGSTRWTLREIEPSGGNELRRIDLPFGSPYLRIIAGEKYWTFLEQSRNEGSAKPGTLTKTATQIPTLQINNKRTTSITLDSCKIVHGDGGH